MRLYKFKLDPPDNPRPSTTIRWFLASSEDRAFAQATAYLRMAAFSSRTKLSLLGVEEPSGGIGPLPCPA
jgi:hypothetical protein